MRKENELLTVKKTAEILGINPATVRRWDKKGKLKGKRHPINNYRLYLKNDVKELANDISSLPRKKAVI